MRNLRWKIIVNVCTYPYIYFKQILMLILLKIFSGCYTIYLTVKYVGWFFNPIWLEWWYFFILYLPKFSYPFWFLNLRYNLYILYIRVVRLYIWNTYLYFFRWAVRLYVRYHRKDISFLSLRWNVTYKVLWALWRWVSVYSKFKIS